MHLVDTHFHLDVEFFGSDRDEVVARARARAARVTRIIVPAIKFENIPRVLAMTDQYEGVYGSLNR